MDVKLIWPCGANPWAGSDPWIPISIPSRVYRVFSGIHTTHGTSRFLPPPYLSNSSQSGMHATLCIRSSCSATCTGLGLHCIGHLYQPLCNLHCTRVALELQQVPRAVCTPNQWGRWGDTTCSVDPGPTKTGVTCCTDPGTGTMCSGHPKPRTSDWSSACCMC